MPVTETKDHPEARAHINTKTLIMRIRVIRTDSTIGPITA